MPTTKFRVMVPLSDPTHSTLARMAALDGVTVGQLIASLVEPAVPVLERVLEAAEALTALRTEAKQGLAGVMGAAQGELEGFLGALRAGSAPLAALGVPEPHGTLQSLPGAARPRDREHAAQRMPGAVPPQSKEVLSRGGKGSRPPYSNTGVILTASKRNQSLSKGGHKAPKQGRKGGTKRAV